MTDVLSHQQRQQLSGHIKDFLKYTDSDQFREDQADRVKRIRFFDIEVPRKLSQLSEADLHEIIAPLWAIRMWGNKQYVVQQLIADNGLERLRKELAHLLDRSKPPGERYEQFLRNIKHLGPSSVTEMLCYNEPKRCGIWNRKAREALKILGLGSVVDPSKYRLTGVEYETFNRLLQKIAEELTSYGLADVDLLIVDFFLYKVFESKTRSLKDNELKIGFDHDEIRDLIANIGQMLGFDTQTELRIAHGARADVVWRAKIGNLGLVTYVFEVHKSGSIDGLLLNLQKARGNPTVQKVIAVSDERQLEQIKQETAGLPEEFRKAMAFWKVNEVQEVAEKLQSVSEIIGSLGLVPGDSFS